AILVKDLAPGMIFAEPIITESGTILIDKGMPVFPRYKSLLTLWGIHSVYIQESIEDKAPDKKIAEGRQPQVESCTKFLQEYTRIVTKTSEAFNLIRDYKAVPVQELKDISFGIYATVLSTGTAIVDYLLMNNNTYADKLSRHSVMVALISTIIGQEIQLPEKDLNTLILSSMLYDIGKFTVPKQDDQNPYVHVLHGSALIENIDGLPEEITLTALQHHELMDGGGKPSGLKGAQIHLFARIIAIANEFQNETFHEDCVNPFPVLQSLSAQMYNKYDPRVCIPFLIKMRNLLLNTSVLLSDGQTARVILFPDGMIDRPVVQTTSGDIIDLSKNNQLSVQSIITPDYLSLV
ncbi:MAG: HD-GYP domain-containing protein, partial [Sporomusa sp.]